MAVVLVLRARMTAVVAAKTVADAMVVMAGITVSHVHRAMSAVVVTNGAAGMPKSNRAQRNAVAQSPAPARAPEQNKSWKDRKEARSLARKCESGGAGAEYDRERRAIKSASVVVQPPAPAAVPPRGQQAAQNCG